MNKFSINPNLKQAKSELEHILGLLDSDEGLSEAAFQAYLQHTYHHLNFAWNSRLSPDNKVVNLSQRDYTRWGKFPKGKDWGALRLG